MLEQEDDATRQIITEMSHVQVVGTEVSCRNVIFGSVVMSALLGLPHVAFASQRTTAQFVGGQANKREEIRCIR